ncbi:MAG: FprA family A-type flavoprotein [Eubacteriales bacterium]|nr:FprA family A-type flavoprotein [Eubacteriales bacterium]
MLEIKDRIYSVGVQNADLKVFDIIMRTPKGTSYNAYLVKGDQKAALVDTVKDGFSESYFQSIEEIMPVSEIDYLILSHTEPDHAGTIALLLEKNPGLKVVGSSSAIQFTGHIINKPFDAATVKKGDSIDLGGRVLSFYPMPNLHWPDTMFTYDSLTGALFTCDFLGAHYSWPNLLYSSMTPVEKADYDEGLLKYYLDIMSPFSDPFVTNGIKAARQLQPTAILTGHGAILDENLDHFYGLYEKWAARKPREAKMVVIPYVSAYGYTQKLADTIAETLKEEGITAKLVEASENKDEALAAIQDADGVLFGSPTFIGDMLQPIGELLSALHPYVMKGKPAAAFGSYGWSGEAVGFITQRLDQLKAKTMEGFRARLNPSEEELAGVREFARNFARML